MEKQTREDFLASIETQPRIEYTSPLTYQQVDQALALDELTLAIDVQDDVGFAIDPEVKIESDLGVEIVKLESSFFLSDLKLKHEFAPRFKTSRLYVKLANFEQLKDIEVDCTRIAVDVTVQSEHGALVVKHVKFHAQHCPNRESMAIEAARY